jgi:hypothetical protein
VIRRTDVFKIVWGILIESGRCQVTVEAIHDHFYRLQQEIENVPAAFIFNADESSFQDFVDAREVHIIVSAEFESDSISIPSQRSEKRATMLAAISADGCALIPMVIIQRETYKLDLSESEFTPDKVLIAHRERGFIDRQHFDIWEETVPFPEIEERWIEYQ